MREPLYDPTPGLYSARMVLPTVRQTCVLVLRSASTHAKRNIAGLIRS